MILTIYSTKYLQELPDEALRRALQLLPIHIQEIAVKFRRWQDAYACIFGKLLLKAALQEEGFQNDLPDLQYTPYGMGIHNGIPDPHPRVL